MNDGKYSMSRLYSLNPEIYIVFRRGLKSIDEHITLYSTVFSEELTKDIVRIFFYRIFEATE